MKLLILCAWLFLVPEIQSFEIIAGDFSDVSPVGTPGSDKIVDGPSVNINKYERRQKRSDDNSKEEEEDHIDEHITIHSYKVKSIITSRFAETVFSTKVVNKDLSPQNVVFNVEIPKGAYISNFTMTVNDITFVGSVHETNVARKLYAEALAQGKAAGILRTSAHEMESFKAEVNVPGGSKVSFELYCQELLQRRLGFYEQTIILHPGSLVKQLQVHSIIFLATLCTQWTVEAMATILSDLRPEDQFTIIDFNHNIRFWNQHLVPATPNQIEDAKKYIEKIQPSGGTNINEAVLSAIYILTEANNLGLLDPRSVSFIIMVSDGDPTVGEIKLSNIQRNVRRKMQEDISLFCLGIGFDVDYDFLERIALENRGIARRIIANVNASSQLKDFYEEVATPLLRKIDIHYGDDVTDVTQSSFDKYFSGSEIIVAGKLAEKKPSPLQCLVTASSANDDLMFQVDSPIDELDKILAKQKYVLPEFAKQLWAYLTINQLLSERVLAQSALQKRNITSRILAIALVHQLITPVTAMMVENDETGQRLLADSPKSTRNGCCTGTPIIGKKTPAIPTWAKKSYSTPQPPQQLIRPEVDSKVGMNVPVTSVENDPHFIIHLPKSKQDICFNVNPQPGKILNLVSDPIKGIAINGKIIGGKQTKNGKLNTYFGTIGLHFTNLNLSFEINTEKIRLKDGQRKTLLWWSESSILTHAGVVVSVQRNTNVTITVGEDMVFLILLHRVWKNHPTNVDFLGFYASPKNNFSTSVHGLIGQFIHEPEVNVYDIHQGSDPDKPQATMEVKGHRITVTRGLQKDYRTGTVNGTDVQCWFIHNSGKGFIDGHFKDYLVPHLYSFLNHP
ncbi:inter-alpha-trypsin inhibitor heavy chain H2 [Chiloscyllium plagiosum]|uniref:inter-alpha-trypsin inhibitor heavy chain H2 n=1 Tax=Chiloscyllium plagiosum TaxID=36176 RepID=UPI001CB7B02B|nr:inter-alpha-trypsin inhibitor heavy chain H2 [Chiloscyllium plagiosum]